MPEPDEPVESKRAAEARIRYQQTWVDHQIELARERGEFDDLPGAGKPLDLTDADDPDWWVKRLIAREQITGVLPEALQLRKDDRELSALLDRKASEGEVRRVVEEFNARVIAARRQLAGGPPVITKTRDVEAEVGAWRDRRAPQLRRPEREPSHRWWGRRWGR